MFLILKTYQVAVTPNMGCYESGAEFAQSIAEDCGEVGSNSSWIEIDWKASWDNLSYDYVESDNGHIFSQNF